MTPSFNHLFKEIHDKIGECFDAEKMKARPDKPQIDHVKKAAHTRVTNDLMTPGPCRGSRGVENAAHEYRGKSQSRASLGERFEILTHIIKISLKFTTFIPPFYLTNILIIELY